jgi:hypothetical protein
MYVQEKMQEDFAETSDDVSKPLPMGATILLG